MMFFYGPLLDAIRLRSWPDLILGNLLSQTGSMGLAVLPGSRPLLYPTPVWHALNAAALVAGLALFAILAAALGAYVRALFGITKTGRARRVVWDRSASTWLLIVLFAVLFGIGLSGWSVLLSTYDRYLWPLVLPLYAVLLRPPSSQPGCLVESSATSTFWRLSKAVFKRAPTAVAVLTTVALSITSLTLLTNGDAYDSARWRMGDLAVSRGIAAETVDAGYEWVTLHATSAAALDSSTPALGKWYDALWPSFHLCALVSGSPLSTDTVTIEEVDPAAYQLYLFIGPSEPLYLYRVSSPDCP